MDGQHFDNLARKLALTATRRAFLRAALGGAAGALLTTFGIGKAQIFPCPAGRAACNGVCCSECEQCKPGKFKKYECISDCKNGLICILGQCSCADGRSVCWDDGTPTCCVGDAACLDGACACPAESGGTCADSTGIGPVRISCCSACEECRRLQGGRGKCASTCPEQTSCGASGQCVCNNSDGFVVCGNEENLTCCEHGCDGPSQCRCPAGHTRCGNVECCDDACEQCVFGECQDMCPFVAFCDAGHCRCPGDQPLCGSECCGEGATCVQGLCVCTPGSSPCRTRIAPGFDKVRCCSGCETCEPVRGKKARPDERVCQSRCPEGSICDEGSCECPDGYELCGNPGTEDDGICCSTFCGACGGKKCGDTCPGPLNCQGNGCVCPDGQPACNDKDHGVLRCCEVGATCVAGECRCSRDAGTPCVREVKVKHSPHDLEFVTCCADCEGCSDAGICVTDCPKNQMCDPSGECLCPDGRKACLGVCCGACQVCGVQGCEICTPPTTCVSGVCECPERWSPCGTTCCDETQVCRDDLLHPYCACPDESPSCQGRCCYSSKCEVCGPDGCEATCEGPCNTCDDGDCLPLICADDGDICTSNVCDPDQGGCVAQPIENCCITDDDCPNDGNPCIRSNCDRTINRCDVQVVNEIDCDSGTPCNGPGTCVAGQCEPGPSLCGPCQVCTDAGCINGEDEIPCLEGVCCGGDCIPVCQELQVRAEDCSCTCPETAACDPGSAFDPSSCACCRTVCLPGECGEIPDGCGGPPLQCTEDCCEPVECPDVGANCGEVSDGCTETPLYCGDCTSPETCGGGGVANQCGNCIGATCEEAGLECGWLEDDGCGVPLDCGACNTVCGACTPVGGACDYGAEQDTCCMFCQPSGICGMGEDQVCLFAFEPCTDDGSGVRCCSECVDGCCSNRPI